MAHVLAHLQKAPAATVPLLAALVLALFGGWQIERSRSMELSDAHREARSLARSLAQHAERTIETADILLSGAVERVEMNPDRDGLTSYLTYRARSASQVQNLIVTNAAGQWLFDSVGPHAPVSSAERSYFKWHLANQQDTELHIGTPIRGLAGGPLAIPLTRRISGSDGQFAGVVLAALKLQYFESFYQSIGLGERSAIALWSNDGKLLARYPPSPDSVERDFSAVPLLQAARAHPSGVYNAGPGPIDRIERIVAYERLTHYPSLTVSASISIDEALSSWRSEAALEGAVLGVAILVLWAFAFRQYVHQRLRATAEAAAYATSALLTTTLQSMDQGLLVIDPDQRVVVCNQRALALLGLPPALMDGKPTVQTILECRADASMFLLEQSDNTSRTAETVLDLRSSQVKMPDGRVLEVRSSATADGGSVSTYTDVTTLIRAEDSLKKSESSYRQLAETSADMIVVADLDSRKRYVSPASRELLGFEPDELMGTLAADFVHPDDAAGLAETVGKLRTGQVERATSTHRFKHRDGSYVWVETRCGLLREASNNDPTGYIAVVRNISERKRDAERVLRAKEEAENSAQAKSDFLATMSHELRTPLNSVIGFSGIMLDSDELNTPRMRRYAHLIQDASSTLLSIVNDVLDMSKIEAREVELDPRSFSPILLLEGAVELVRGQAQSKGLELRLFTDPLLPLALFGDDSRLRQILLNLLSNAVKFTARGFVSARATVEFNADPERVCVRFVISDSGIGIPLSKRHRLFKAFSQVDASTSRDFGGTGLGLSICKSLVEMMGSSISVESDEGHGSTFSFAVDLLRDDSLASGQDDLSPAVAPTPGLRILLAEDVPVNQELALALLTKRGYLVDVVEDGAAAVDAVQRVTYDVVLMDIQMPVMDGVEATKRIRELQGAPANIPIVAMTANVLPDDVARFRAAGMTAHVGKPFSPRGLVEAIERFAIRTDVASEDQQRSRSQQIRGCSTPENSRFEQLRATFGSQKTKSLLEMFDAQLSKTLINDSEDAPDTAALLREAHKIVSTAGAMGFAALSDICSDIERVCRDGATGTESLPRLLISAQVIKASTQERIGVLIDELRNAA